MKTGKRERTMKTMNEIMMEILQAVIVVVLVILTKYLIPYIKAKVEESQYNWILGMIEDAVQYAEMTIKDEHSGERKLSLVTNYVRERLAEKNITLSEEQIRAIIESAVYTMKEVG